MQNSLAEQFCKITTQSSALYQIIKCALKSINTVEPHTLASLNFVIIMNEKEVKDIIY